MELNCKTIDIEYQQDFCIHIYITTLVQFKNKSNFFLEN